MAPLTVNGVTASDGRSVPPAALPAGPELSPWQARRRSGGRAHGPIEAYLASLATVLEGQLDSALQVGGVAVPLGCVARAALLEQIGADLDAATRDLLLSGVPPAEAEARAVAAVGPADELGRALMDARRRREIATWQRRDAVWWWTEPVLPVAAIGAAVLLAALAPTLAVIAGMVAQPHLGGLSFALVPLVLSVLCGLSETLAADIDYRLSR